MLTISSVSSRDKLDCSQQNIHLMLLASGTVRCYYYLMPRIDELLDRLHGSAVYSTFDFTDAFSRISTAGMRASGSTFSHTHPPSVSLDSKKESANNKCRSGTGKLPAFSGQPHIE